MCLRMKLWIFQTATAPLLRRPLTALTLLGSLSLFGGCLSIKAPDSIVIGGGQSDHPDRERTQTDTEEDQPKYDER